jgi:hypothetical protein
MHSTRSERALTATTVPDGAHSAVTSTTGISHDSCAAAPHAPLATAHQTHARVTCDDVVVHCAHDVYVAHSASTVVVVLDVTAALVATDGTTGIVNDRGVSVTDTDVGALVGPGVGTGVGSGDGTGVGPAVACGVGNGVGRDGIGEGCGEGCGVGIGVGPGDGTGVGCGEGCGVGMFVGAGVGMFVGAGVGAIVSGAGVGIEVVRSMTLPTPVIVKAYEPCTSSTWSLITKVYVIPVDSIIAAVCAVAPIICP